MNELHVNLILILTSYFSTSSCSNDLIKGSSKNLYRRKYIEIAFAGLDSDTFVRTQKERKLKYRLDISLPFSVMWMHKSLFHQMVHDLKPIPQKHWCLVTSCKVGIPDHTEE